MFHSYFLYLEVAMKEKVASLVNEQIKEFNVFVHDAFMSTEDYKKIFNIILDSEDVIDLNKITDASRIIYKIIDNHEEILDDCDELDIYSNEKGEIEGE